jgi:hypothetical protein
MLMLMLMMMMMMMMMVMMMMHKWHHFGSRVLVERSSNAAVV